MFDDSWRDSYDAWKLATPPEYETADDEREREEADRADEFQAWLAAELIDEDDFDEAFGNV